MFIPSLVIAFVVVVGLVGLQRRRSLTHASSSPRSPWLDPGRSMGVALLAVTTGASLFLTMGTASAAIVDTIELGDASVFSVLAGTTVTNTGPSVLALSVGVSPGTAITGFGGADGSAATVEADTQPAIDGQAALTTAYNEAESRIVEPAFLVTPELGGLTLVGGVYATNEATSLKDALSLTGNLTLDGAGDPNSVFIFQTNSTLSTAGASSVTLINGAQACNVFWQVGSSATLSGGSTFVGNILALTSISVGTGVTVEGRALARSGAVTLDTDTFTTVGCDMTVATTTTLAATTTTLAATTTTAAATTTTAAVGTTTTSAAVGTTTTTLATASPTTTVVFAVAGTTTTTVGPLEAMATTTTEAGGATEVTTPGSSTSLPFTGQNSIGMLVVAMLSLILGIGVLRMSRRDAMEQD